MLVLVIARVPGGLTDYNDWANLYFLGTGDADGLSPVATEIISEQWLPEELERFETLKMLERPAD